MSDPSMPVTEDELHAYVDGELPDDRRAVVDAWLATHPEGAARVGAWRAQAEMIRTRFGAAAEEPIPPRLNPDRLMHSGRRWHAIAAAAAIAAIVAFGLGGITGWMARGASATAPGPLQAFSHEALAAHRLYTGEVLHPVEVGAAETHLLPWLSRRTGTQLRTPDLAVFDFKLLGGRLLPGASGPAALFMYENSSGERVTLYCAPLTSNQAALRYNAFDNFATVQWVEGGHGWAISGPADKSRLTAIAKSAYEQLENRTPPIQRSKADPLLSLRRS